MTPRQILHIITVSSGEPVLLELLPVVAEHTADMTIVHCPPPVALLLDVSLGLQQAVRGEATRSAEVVGSSASSTFLLHLLPLLLQLGGMFLFVIVPVEDKGDVRLHLLQ